MTRQCGSCTLCCKLLPVKELGKAANTRCRHQSFARGCKVYRRAGFPLSCGLWSCSWLTDEDTADMARPDRSGYVIDMMPDYVRQTRDNGEEVVIPVIQIWCDPARPNAHRDPALRAYLQRRAKERGEACLVRYGNDSAMLLVAPELSGKADFVEIRSNLNEEEHTAADLARHLTDYQIVEVVK